MKIKLIVFTSFMTCSVANAMGCSRQAFTDASKLQYHLLGIYPLKINYVESCARQLAWLFTDPAKVEPAINGIQSLADASALADDQDGDHLYVNALITALELATTTGLTKEKQELEELETLTDDQRQMFDNATQVINKLCGQITLRQEAKQLLDMAI